MKRIVCFLLALVMILGMIPNTVTTANAASKWTTSAKAIDILKGSVTFYEKEKDGKIGYSIDATFKLDGESVAKTYKNGISKEDATDLLRAYLKEEVDVKINDFTKNNNIDLSQNEHDALAVHYFRMDGAATIFEAIRTIKTVNSAADRAAIVKAFVDSRPHTYTSDETVKVTVNVSLAEAAMYLYGDYGYNGSDKLGYARLSTDGDYTADEVVGFVKADGLALAKPATFGGLANDEFLGWYLYDYTDKKPVGAAITKLTKDHSGKLIIAKAANGTVVAEYTINTSTLANQNVYKDHKEDSKDVKGTLKNNTNFKVTKEFLDNDDFKWVYGTGTNTKGKDITGWVKVGKVASSGTASDKPIATATVTSNSLSIYKGATANETNKYTKVLTKNEVVNVYEIKVEKTETGNKNWGKISFVEGGVTYIGWINLVSCDVNETLGESGKPEGQTGKIANTDVVNIRKSDSVHSEKLTSLNQGTKVTILEMNDDRTWAKIKWTTPSNGYTQGWVYMHYVQLDSAAAGSTGSDNGAVLYTGVVTSNINLNVRKSPDIYATKVDSLANGTKINIYETKTSRNMKWGRIGTNRWVCLTYVSLTEVEQPETGSSATTTTSTQATVAIAKLDVLKNYNSNAEKVGSLKKGDVVTILEKNTEKTQTGERIWGRISEKGIEGWINLAYVELKTVTSVNGSNSDTTSTGTTNANGANAVISNCISVNVREGAGVSNAQITKLNNGTPVKVYEQVTKDNAPWAKITWNNGANSGWVCMNYVTMTTGSTGTTTEGGLVNGTNSNTISATGVVNSNIDLNVRSTAGLDGIKLGSLKKGTKVTVYEQVSADGMIWGRIQYGNGSGWICMSYISIESASSTGKGVMGTIARCFAAVNVRSAPGTNNALINKIAVGTRVEVFETRQHGTQLWGRVAQGWICMDYVLLDSELPPGTVLDATEATTAPTQANQTEETVNRDGEIAFTVEADILRELNVYNDADEDSHRVGKIYAGEKVDILAVKNNGAELWGRIDQYAIAGWIKMDKADVYYYFDNMYVITDEQPIYTDADMNSTVKGSLSINTILNIKKVSTDGTNAYGWVEEGIFGWIPMSKLSTKPADVISVLNDAGISGSITGKTFSAMEAVDVIGGSKVIYKLASGATVMVDQVKIENRQVWGKIAAFTTADGKSFADAWIDMAKVNYTLTGTLVGSKVDVRSTMDADSETNIVGSTDAGIKVCQLTFDGYGNLWARVTNNSDESLNGAFVMVKAAAQNVDGKAENYVSINAIY